MTINPLIAAKPSFRAAVRRAAVAACLVAASAPAALADTSGGGEIHPPGLPCGYTVEVIERPECQWPMPDPVIYVSGLNERGTVVGYRNHCDVAQPRHVAWIWQPGDTAPTDLSLPSDVYSGEAYDINDDGVICGRFRRESEPWRGFVYDTNTGEWTELEPVDPTGSGQASANAINNAGVVAGTRSIGESHQPYNAFIWSADDGYTDLGVMEGPNSDARDINNDNEVVGWTGQSSILAQAFRYRDQTASSIDMPSGNSSSAVSVNDQGDVCGTFLEVEGSNLKWRLGFVADANSQVSVIDTLPEFEGTSTGWINDSGTVTGFFTVEGVNEWHGFVWHDGHALLLNDLAVGKDVHASRPRDINSAGQILVRGSAEGYSSSIGLVLSPVESPLGDLSGDCQVGPADLGLLLSEWSNDDSPADLTGDGTVGGADLGMLLSNWTH